MIGRRTAALLCVLLAHALVIFALMGLKTPLQRELETSFSSEPITIILDEPLPPAPSVAGADQERVPRAPPVATGGASGP